MVNKDKKNKDHLNAYVVQKPNIKMLNIPFRLYVYNLGNQNYQEKWQERIQKYQDSNNNFTKIFSLKQGVGYANFQKNLSEWIFKNGESPIIFDPLKAEKTKKSLRLYYLDKGYFNTKVGYTLDTLNDKNIHVNYKITTGEPYTLDSIKVQIASPVLDSLYQKNKAGSFIQSNKTFDRTDFENEAERLTNLFRNSGVFYFSKLAINFRELDSTQANHKTNVLLDIPHRLIEKTDTIYEAPYCISYIKKVNVFTDYSYVNDDKSKNDSLFYNGYHFYFPRSLNYKPKYLSRQIFIHPGDKYSDINIEKTRQQLRSLNNFKSIRFNFSEESDSSLVANILLTPMKRFGLKIENEWIHSNIKPLGISGKITFKNINTFRGNEIFQLGIQGSFFNSVNFNQILLNAWEIGIDANFKVPRLITPFKTTKFISEKMSPKTNMTLGTSLQRNIGLDKQRFTGILEYTWNGNKRSNFVFEILNTQLIKNLNIESFFDIYSSEYKKLLAVQTEFFPTESLDNALAFINLVLGETNFETTEPDAYNVVQNVKNRYEIITEDVLVPAASFSFTYNTQTNFKDQDFMFFRSRFTSSGLLSSALSQNTSAQGNKQLLGVNIVQYLKWDFDYKKYWGLNPNSTLALRTNLGVAIPYGNSKSIPFSRSYFAGGPNDIRAWKIYELGPGSENSGLEFNVGNLKLLSSIEYRFDIINSFKGALFLDAGNIWDITNSELTSDKAKFKGLNSLNKIAIGTGFGIRYDFSFLVFRADVGFKTFEPYGADAQKWFHNYNFKKAVLNIGINYPF